MTLYGLIRRNPHPRRHKGDKRDVGGEEGGREGIKKNEIRRSKGLWG